MSVLSKRNILVGVAVVAVAGVGFATFQARHDPGANGGPAVMRRLTQEQYRNTVQDVFGSSVSVAGRFEPDNRSSHLIAIGSGMASVTASGLEGYDRMAKGIAAQIVDEQHRAQVIPCKPVDVKAPDDACARQFLARVGHLLYRRPLTDNELTSNVAATNAATQKVGDFYVGLRLAVAGLLESPQFLYRHETSEPDPDNKGGYRLDALSKAARLSFLLWNTTPDMELLNAAEKGELNTDKGLAKQVDRLLASPRLEAGMRAFFTDMLEFDSYDTLAKDGALYPKFNINVALDSQEQTLRTVIDLLLKQKGDYRDLFTTRKTFLTPMLGSIYKVAVETPDGLPNQWVPYEFPADSGQAGILTQASFVALHSHPGRSSPTLRGKALREVLLCQKVPDPPGNVNFNLVQDTANPNYKTVRQRLTAHATEATCTGCHKIMDPVGLALENFDTIGGYRMNENGADIDTSGELDGSRFADAPGLGKALHDHPEAPSCLVNRVFSYGVGRLPTNDENEWLKTYVDQRFAADGYRLPELLRRIATSETFYRVQAPDGAKAPAVASAELNSGSEIGK
jgi:hypothetical protein